MEVLHLAAEALRTDHSNDIARMLLDHGADIHVQGGEYDSAWHAAKLNSDSQSIDIPRLLADHGANVNDARGYLYATALCAALAEEPDTETRKYNFLLDNGVDVNTPAGPYGSALQFALCRSKDGRGARRLLEDFPDINVNAQGGLFGNSLQAAAYRGWRDLGELLLKPGADAKPRGRNYCSAPNAAIIMGFWDIVEILIDHGALPNNAPPQRPKNEWLHAILNGDGRGAVERDTKFWRWKTEDSGRERGLAMRNTVVRSMTKPGAKRWTVTSSVTRFFWPFLSQRKGGSTAMVLRLFLVCKSTHLESTEYEFLRS